MDMNHKKLSDALGYISDHHIAEAVKPKRKSPWIPAIAAILVFAIALGIILHPRTTENVIMQSPTLSTPSTDSPPKEPAIPFCPNTAVVPLSNKYAVATPDYPVLCAYPTENEFDDNAYAKWHEAQRTLHDQPEGYADSLQSLWQKLTPALLAGNTGENVACSPLNIYMALAMLAECTAGESRQQLLTLMNADSMETLRLQANQVWRAHYNDDGLTRSILGSSLWLEENYGFDSNTVKLLAENYYASVFQGDLGTEEMNDTLHDWLNAQTGGLLQEQAANVRFDPMTVLAIATTIYYQTQWQEEFSEKRNTTEIFHGATGDTTETFMNTALTYGPYYWSDHFGAVCLNLEGNARMWLFLPDAGISPETITDEVTGFLAQQPALYDSQYQNQKSLRVNLSLPKFDIASDLELIETLKNLGVTDIFDGVQADFSPILPRDDGGCVNQIKHAARVTIDEKGVTAAAFTAILRCGSAMPPTNEMDFVLDRPFMFCIESQDGLPLFTGIVNEP